MEGDCMANLMYDAWVSHGIKPSIIYNMTRGEQQLIRAFFVIEQERRSKLNER